MVKMLRGSIFSGAGQKEKKNEKSEKQVLTTGRRFGIVTECLSGGANERLWELKKNFGKPKISS